jgi:hypothetical protein
MKLSECRLGEIVRQQKGLEGEPLPIGHIVGLTVNNVGEVIPLVQFAGYVEAFGCHHNNLELYRD